MPIADALDLEDPMNQDIDLVCYVEASAKKFMLVEVDSRMVP